MRFIINVRAVDNPHSVQLVEDDFLEDSPIVGHVIDEAVPAVGFF